jgi:hypothetical protein
VTTKPELWTLGRLRSAKGVDGSPPVIDDRDPVAFRIPEFQRSLVWPRKKQEQLIQSIIRGYPIGALLLVESDDKFEHRSADGKRRKIPTYGIIDGLQRTNAIADHLNMPLNSITEDVLDAAIVADLSEAISRDFKVSINAEELEDHIIAWLKDVKIPEPKRGFEHDSLMDAITEAHSLPDPTRDQLRNIRSILIDLLDHVQSAVDITQQQMPVLIYSGPSENLPEIFERINTQGTVLSKYEIFAAAWVNQQVTIASTDVKNAIRTRYTGLEEEGFQVERTTSPTTYSLFDYLYGLSHVLGQRFPRLYPRDDPKKGRASVAFSLATLILGHPLEKMSELPKLLPRKADKTLDVSRLERAILDSSKHVDTILARHLGLALRNESEALAHSELQMASVVAATSAYLFDASEKLKSRRLSLSHRQKLERAIPQHYLYDIIRQEWRGPLYTYAFERAWKAPRIRADYYLKPIDRSAFKAALATSLQEQLTETSHSRRNITASDRALLKFVYSGLITAGEQAQHKFDIEHLYPVARLTKLTAGKEPWAIGALANLAILPAPINRRKKDETVSQYVARTKSPPSPEEVRLIDKLTLIPVNEIDIPRKSGRDLLREEQYVSTLKKRWRNIESRLIKSLDLR